MSNRAVCLLVLLSLVAQAAFAANPRDLIARATEAYTKGEYARSADLFGEAVAAGATDGSSLYNTACASALAGRSAAALDFLARAVDAGYTNTVQMKSDTDLASIAGTERFREIIATAEAINERRERMWNSPALATPYAETLSVDERVAGLSRIWSEARFNFVYFDLVPELDWDALYLQYLPRVREAESTLEYYKLLTSFLAHLRDGHTGVVPPLELRPMLWSRPALRVTPIEGRMIVTEAFDPVLRDIAGHEIVAIDGIAVADYVADRIRPYLSASTPQDLEARTAHHLLDGAAGSEVALTLVDETGKQAQRSVRRLSSEERTKLAAGDPAFEFRMLPGNIAYVALNHFGSREAADGYLAHFDQIAKAGALIVDIRENGGGNGGEGYRVLGTLTDKPFMSSRWSTRMYKPTFRAWSRGEEMFESEPGEIAPNGKLLFDKPVVVLLGARTYSAAEDFAVAFDAMKRGTMIGEPTGGSTGQPLIFRLPGGGSARVCTKRDTYPDGKAFVGVGVQPQQVVTPTVSDARKGVDTVLEAAVRFLRKTG